MMSGISNNNHNFTGAVGKAVITHSKTAESGKESRIGKINRKPDQISKDGDTLELSRKNVPDAVLKGYTDARLKSMLQKKEISRQQYDNAVNLKNENAESAETQASI